MRCFNSVIENKKDLARTRYARRHGEFEDPRSYYNIAGHVFLRGVDRSQRRRQVFEFFKMICQVCGKHVKWHEADYDHMIGGSKHRRCDCWNTLLADGSLHSNVQLVHGMFSKEPCHRRKHHRVILLKEPDHS